jgi:LPXTG-site transpeptidase (sortase) family protein
MKDHKTRPISTLIVASLAVAFVLYHLWQSVVGTASFALAYLPKPTPVVQHKQAADTTSTPSAQIKTVAAPILGFQANSSLWPTRVVMPSASIDLPLTGSIEQNGSWDISLTGANFALNTALPNGKNGNTVLFGHDRPKLFRTIHNLKIGDTISIIAPNGTYSYKMTSSLVVAPTDVSVMDQTATSTLTLITCDGWLSENRYVVQATFDHFTPIAVAPSSSLTSSNSQSSL